MEVIKINTCDCEYDKKWKFCDKANELLKVWQSTGLWKDGKKYQDHFKNHPNTLKVSNN